jgi:predicted dehydrogenase
MTIRVGILGLGFMGKCHYDHYQDVSGAEVVAIAESDPRKRRGDWSAIGGNIGGGGGRVDVSHLTMHSKAEALFADEAVDIVDVCLPTHLHAEMTVAALEAGKHVICEKPMALTSKEGRRMMKAAQKARRKLFVAQCIRFWPAYAKAREIVQSETHGRLVTAVFNRFSTTPTWGWKNWLQDEKKSGLCALDLHIHDADFVLYLLGKPKSVSSHGAGLKRGRLDHIVTVYEYRRDQLVKAEGGWEYAPGFPFSMSFAIHMETASLYCGADLSLWLYPERGKAREIRVPEGDGYGLELQHFVDCVREDRSSDVVSPAEALKSVKLVECEMKSALSGRRVPVKW